MMSWRIALLLPVALAAGTAQAAIVVPIQIEQNLVIAQVRVGTSPPLAFLVDTGASATVIDAARVPELGLAAGSKGAGTAQGGEIETEMIEGAVLRVGGAELRPARVAAIDLSGLAAGFGRRIDGILGYELFARYRVRIDYRRRRMILDPPAGRAAAGEEIPIEIRGNTPFLTTRLTQSGRGRAAPLLVDLGATGALTLYSAYVAAHPELVPARTLQVSSGALLPGRFHARVGRIERMGIGRFAFRDVLTNFSATNGGDDDTEGAAGQIGGELLSRFTITFDCAGKRMTLTPARPLSAPFRFDASGASLRASGARFEVKEVRAVLPGSPAESAGLRSGDVIERIDGRPAAAIPLARLRAMLRKPGTAYGLRIVREGRRQLIRLRTRTLI